MRRFVLLLIAILTLVPLWSNQLTDIRSVAMGSTSIGVVNSHLLFPTNPASIYFQQEPLFRVGTRQSEKVLTKQRAEDPIPWLQEPTTSIEVLFTNRYLGLSLALSNYLDQRSVVGDDVEFTAFNESELQLSLAYGWQSIAFGLYAKGSTFNTRDVVVRKKSSFSDYVNRTYFERYYARDIDNQTFNSAIGMLLSYNFISIGLLSDSLLNYDYDSGELNFDIEQTLQNFSVGLAFSTPNYNKDNELKRIVFNGGADFVKVRDVDDGSLHLGLETLFQFTNNFSVALRGGYWEKRGGKSSLFALDGSGSGTVGLGVRFLNGAIDVAITIPTELQHISVATGFTWGF